MDMSPEFVHEDRGRKFEECGGCGKLTLQYWPWVGVEPGAPGSTVSNPGENQVPDHSESGRLIPVCDECHKNPENRVRVLDVTFWPRTHYMSAQEYTEKVLQHLTN